MSRVNANMVQFRSLSLDFEVLNIRLYGIGDDQQRNVDLFIHIKTHFRLLNVTWSRRLLCLACPEQLIARRG